MSQILQEKKQVEEGCKCALVQMSHCPSGSLNLLFNARGASYLLKAGSK
jgi:hypothetical protein